MQLQKRKAQFSMVYNTLFLNVPGGCSYKENNKKQGVSLALKKLVVFISITILQINKNCKTYRL